MVAACIRGESNVDVLRVLHFVFRHVRRQNLFPVSRLQCRDGRPMGMEEEFSAANHDGWNFQKARKVQVWSMMSGCVGVRKE